MLHVVRHAGPARAEHQPERRLRVNGADAAGRQLAPGLRPCLLAVQADRVGQRAARREVGELDEPVVMPVQGERRG
ncbi:MAG: hypothetical protein ACRDSI_19280 [Pseudonocardiaceae bacterium]